MIETALALCEGLLACSALMALAPWRRAPGMALWLLLWSTFCLLPDGTPGMWLAFLAAHGVALCLVWRTAAEVVRQ
jgi:hypothetical protein